MPEKRDEGFVFQELRISHNSITIDDNTIVPGSRSTKFLNFVTFRTGFDQYKSYKMNGSFKDRKLL